MRLLSSRTDTVEPQSLLDHNALWLQSDSNPVRRCFVAGTCPAYSSGDFVVFQSGTKTSERETVLLEDTYGNLFFPALLRTLVEGPELAVVMEWYTVHLQLELEGFRNEI